MHRHSKRSKREKPTGGRSSSPELPPEILHLIAQRLGNDDVRRFRAVCRTWRQSYSPDIIPNLPFEIPNSSKTLDSFLSPPRRRPLLCQTSVYLLSPPAGAGTSKPWMVRAEELENGKIRLRHPLTRRRLPGKISFPKNSPRVLDLGQIRASERLRGYNLAYCPPKCRVLAAKNGANFSAMVLQYDLGTLMGFPLVENIADEDLMVKNKEYDDIVSFQGMVFGVDWAGNLFELDSQTLEVIETVVSQPIYRVTPERQKRLVVGRLSEFDEVESLFLVTRRPVFEVLELMWDDKEENLIWERIHSLRGNVLFVGVDHGFFVHSSVFPGGYGEILRDCVVSYADCFPRNGLHRRPPQERRLPDQLIDIFSIADGGLGLKVKPKVRSFLESVWLPPKWVRLAHLSQPSPFVREYSNEEDEEVEVEISEPDARCSREEVTPALEVQGESSNEEDEEVEVEISEPDARCSREEVTPALEVQGESSNEEDEEVEVEVSGPDARCSRQVTPALEVQAKHQAQDNPPPIAHQQQAHSDGILEKQATMVDSTRTVAPTSPCNDSSTMQFQGVDVRADFVPILEKIWRKYGDIMHSSTMRHPQFITIALEALAKAILILQSSSGRSLNDSQANDLESILHDLQEMRFKVEWLVPFVEKALERHRGKALIDTLTGLEKAKSQAEEFRAKLCVQMIALDEQRKLISKSVGALQLDQCLGEGLF